MRELNEITGEIVAAAYDVHTRLGPGLLESVYEAVLAKLLEKRGLAVERQKPIRLQFEGLHFEVGFRVDLLVDGRVLVELKCVEVRARSRKAGAYLSPSDGPADRSAFQFWLGANERWNTPDPQQPCSWCRRRRNLGG